MLPFHPNSKAKLVAAEHIADQFNGGTALAVINSLDFAREYRADILEAHGVIPEPENWQPLRPLINALEELESSIGPKMTFLIGRAIPENTKRPPHVRSIRDALYAFDELYQMNHRGPEVGKHELVEFHNRHRRAIIVSSTPYQSELDRGVLSTLVRQFRPDLSRVSDVVLDPTQPSRKQGHATCTYLISW